MHQPIGAYCTHFTDEASESGNFNCPNFQVVTGTAQSCRITKSVIAPHTPGCWCGSDPLGSPMLGHLVLLSFALLFGNGKSASAPQECQPSSCLFSAFPKTWVSPQQDTAASLLSKLDQVLDEHHGGESCASEFLCSAKLEDVSEGSSLNLLLIEGATVWLPAALQLSLPFFFSEIVSLHDLLTDEPRSARI